MNNRRAALWMIGAIFSFTSMAVAGRAISGQLDTFEIMFYRSIMGFLIVLVVAKSIGTLGEIDLKYFRLHLLRNIFHFIGQNLWFFALPLIPLAQLFALEFTSPIWVLLLAPLILGESLTLRKLAIAALGFIGVLIVAQPEIGAVNIGILAAGSAAIGFAGRGDFDPQADGAKLIDQNLVLSHRATNSLWVALRRLRWGYRPARPCHGALAYRDWRRWADRAFLHDEISIFGPGQSGDAGRFCTPAIDSGHRRCVLQRKPRSLLGPRSYIDFGGQLPKS
jgi:uncharacterized membrane protein